MNLRACCVWLENLLTNAGEKGFSAVPVARSRSRYLVLQARAVDPRSVEELKKPLPPDRKPVSIALSMDLKLSYCGGCGRLLSELIEEQQDAFDKDAAAVGHLGVGFEV